MKKTIYVLAITLVIAGLMITSITSIPVSTDKNEIEQRGVEEGDTPVPVDAFLQRMIRLITGEIDDLDISSTANIDSYKINCSGLDADLIDGLEGRQLLRRDTSGRINGSLTVNGNLMWSRKAGYVSIPAAAFTPKNNGMSWTNDGYQVTGSYRFIASVQLPHNAIVTKLSFYWKDVAHADVSLALVRNNMDGSYDLMALAWTTGASGNGVSYDDTIDNALILNSQYSYYLSVSLQDAELYCNGAIIEYSFAEPY